MGIRFPAKFSKKNHIDDPLQRPFLPGQAGSLLWKKPEPSLNDYLYKQPKGYRWKFKGHA